MSRARKTSNTHSKQSPLPIVCLPRSTIDLISQLKLAVARVHSAPLASPKAVGSRAFMSGTAEPGSVVIIVAPMREDKGSDIRITADAQGYWKATLEPVQASMHYRKSVVGPRLG